MRAWLFGVWLLTAATVLPAQRPAASKVAPTGSVSGHVYYANTNGPARMATVLLEGAAAIDGYQPGAGDGATAHISSVKTLPDGSFSVPHVKPGAYYVFASAPVYSGNKLRQKEAVPFRLKLGEERPGEDLEVPLNKLHGIAGVITAASDGHTVNSGRCRCCMRTTRQRPSARAWLRTIQASR